VNSAKNSGFARNSQSTINNQQSTLDQPAKAGGTGVFGSTDGDGDGDGG